jgi:hypothetical protein
MSSSELGPLGKVIEAADRSSVRDIGYLDLACSIRSLRAENNTLFDIVNRLSERNVYIEKELIQLQKGIDRSDRLSERRYNDCKADILLLTERRKSEPSVEEVSLIEVLSTLKRFWERL